MVILSECLGTQNRLSDPAWSSICSISTLDSSVIIEQPAFPNGLFLRGARAAPRPRLLYTHVGAGTRSFALKPWKSDVKSWALL